jgi:cytoskeletal protein CcmA (bactofilin family)
MKTKFLLSLFLALALALSLTPAYAQGVSAGQNAKVCFGGDTTYGPNDTAKDFSLLGCNGTVENGATVPGTAAVFGGNLTIDQGGTVDGDVAIFGGNTTIAGHVHGNVAILGGAVELLPTAVVDGSVHIVGGAFNRADGAVVSGTISDQNNFRIAPSFERFFVSPLTPLDGFARLGIGIFQGVLTALAMAALGALVVVFFPQPTQRVMAAAQGSFGPSLGAGCLTLLVAPMLFLLLLITLVGPVILTIALAAAWIFGWIAVGYLAGQKVLEALKLREIAPALAVVAGVLLLALLGQVPCIGWLLALLTGTLGVGAVVLTRFGTRPYPFQPALVPVAPVAGPPVIVPATHGQPGTELPPTAPSGEAST